MHSKLPAVLCLGICINACAPKSKQELPSSMPKIIESALKNQPQYKAFEGGAYRLVFKGKAEESRLLIDMPSSIVADRIKKNTQGKVIYIVEVSVKDYSSETHLGGKGWFFFEQDTAILLDVSYGI